MNYLAHLALAQPTVESTVGNLMGDFARGVDPEKLPPRVRSGLENHRAVDRFTDNDTDISDLKSLFSPARRRFSGIALDIYFDHLLINHWGSLESGTADQSICRYYRHIRAGQHLMPGKNMRLVTSRMIEYDWFGKYHDIDAISRAMDRVADRIRFANQFDNTIEDILNNQETIRDAFLAFYPRLRSHVLSLAIEELTNVPS